MNMYLFYNLKSLEKYILKEQEKLACSINSVEVRMFEKQAAKKYSKISPVGYLHAGIGRRYKSRLFGFSGSRLLNVYQPGAVVTFPHVLIRSSRPLILYQAVECILHSRG